MWRIKGMSLIPWPLLSFQLKQVSAVEKEKHAFCAHKAPVATKGLLRQALKMKGKQPRVDKA